MQRGKIWRTSDEDSRRELSELRATVESTGILPVASKQNQDRTDLLLPENAVFYAAIPAGHETQTSA
jgi:hypothetical protein